MSNKIVKFGFGTGLLSLTIIGTIAFIRMYKHVNDENNGSAYQDYERRYISSIIRRKSGKSRKD